MWQELGRVLAPEVLGDWQYFTEVYGKFLVNAFTIHSNEVSS